MYLYMAPVTIVPIYIYGPSDHIRPMPPVTILDYRRQVMSLQVRGDGCTVQQAWNKDDDCDEDGERLAEGPQPHISIAGPGWVSLIVLFTAFGSHCQGQVSLSGVDDVWCHEVCMHVSFAALRKMSRRLLTTSPFAGHGVVTFMEVADLRARVDLSQCLHFPVCPALSLRVSEVVNMGT